jgi:biotin-independent malonate decarboxylase gamma subunit
MSAAAAPSERGRAWFDALADGAPRVETGLGSVLVADATLAGERVRLLAVVPDAHNRFARARRGEVGLDEGWALAHHVREAVAADAAGVKRPILAVVDAPSQAYGRVEELLGIHLSLAAAVDAYATARMAGHPVVALIVGQAISGALLAHGLQAYRLLALDAPGVVVHAMHKEAAARVTRRSVRELDELGQIVLPMSYDIRQYARLGLLHELIGGIDGDSPTAAQVARVKERLAAAIADVRRHPGDLTSRLNHPDARVHRAASIEVRRRMAEQWESP